MSEERGRWRRVSRQREVSELVVYDDSVVWHFEGADGDSVDSATAAEVLATPALQERIERSWGLGIREHVVRILKGDTSVDLGKPVSVEDMIAKKLR